MAQDALQTSGNLGRVWGTIRTLLESTEQGAPDFRGLGQDLEVFEKLAKICFESVLPRKVWLSNFDKKPLSQYMTIPDEALAYLILENNFTDWVRIAKKEVEDTKKRKRDTKFTMVTSGARANLRKGWSLQGKLRYNQYFDVIQLARKRGGVQEMENELLEDWRDDEEELKHAGADAAEESTPVRKVVFTPRTTFEAV